MCFGLTEALEQIRDTVSQFTKSWVRKDTEQLTRNLHFYSGEVSFKPKDPVSVDYECFDVFATFKQ